MSKFPFVEYDGVSGLISGKTAEQIYRFLADEAEMEGKTLEAAMHRARADVLMQHPTAGVKDQSLDQAIAKWGRK